MSSNNPFTEIYERFTATKNRGMHTVPEKDTDKRPLPGPPRSDRSESVEEKQREAVKIAEREVMGGLPAIKRRVNRQFRNSQRADGLRLTDDAPTDVDEFGFRSTAELLAGLFGSELLGTPFVLGVDGKWGSGKTSLCLQMQDVLDRTSGLASCVINAWRFEDLGQLAMDFVYELRQAIEVTVMQRKAAINDPTHFEQFFDVLMDRAGAAEPRWLEPGTEVFIDSFIQAAFSPDRGGLARAIVFIDDLDRCSRDQMRAALQFLRPLTQCENMVIVLPCDKERVLAILADVLGVANVPAQEQTETSSDSTGEPAPLTALYLERIVRLWVTMPTPSRDATSGFILRLMKRADIEFSDDYANMVARVVDGNPRRLKGMANSLSLAMRLDSVRLGDSDRLESDRTLKRLGVTRPQLLLKFFLLRHFWQDQFDLFHNVPDALIRTQNAALQQVEAYRSHQPPVPLEKPLSEWLLDTAFDELLVLPPILTAEAVNEGTHTFLKPIEDIVATVMLCPPALHKAPTELDALRKVKFANESQFRDDVTRRQESAVPVYVSSILTSVVSTILSSPTPSRINEGALSGDEGALPGQFGPNDAPAIGADFQDADGPGQATHAAMRLAIQRLYLETRFARESHDEPGLRTAAAEVPSLFAQLQAQKPALSGDVNEDNLIESLAATLGNIGVQFEMAGDFPTAERVYRSTIEFADEYAGVRYQFADFLVDRGRTEEAREQLTYAIRFDPDDRRRVTTEAKLALKTSGDSPAIEADLRRAFDANPGNNVVAAAYLSILSNSNEPGVMAEFERVCRLWYDALPVEEKKNARRALADYYANHGREVEARAIYQEILPGLTGEDRHQTLHNLATLEAIADDREAALTHWKEAYRLDPLDDQVCAAFNTALFRWGMYDIARRVSQHLPLDE